MNRRTLAVLMSLVPTIPALALWQMPAYSQAKELKIDFFVNRGADVSEDGLDEALKKLNKLFEGAGIKFTRGSVTKLNDPNLPEYPKEAGRDKATDDQKKAAEEAKKAAKKLEKPGQFVVKIVHNFQNPDKKAGDPASVNGITIDGTIVIADPFDVEKNTQGGEEFWHALAHELGHALGLGHKVLASDKDYKHQQNGEYTQPNLMAPDSDARNESNELTADQIDALKKAAARLLGKPQGGGPGGDKEGGGGREGGDRGNR